MSADVIRERRLAKDRLWDAEVYDPAANELDPIVNEPVNLKFSLNTMKAFVSKDEAALRKCDVLLVLTGDYPSDGTWHEIGLAHYERKIPVVYVSPKRARGELVGFSNVKAHAIFETIEEACEFILQNY